MGELGFASLQQVLTKRLRSATCSATSEATTASKTKQFYLKLILLYFNHDDCLHLKQNFQSYQKQILYLIEVLGRE